MERKGPAKQKAGLQITGWERKVFPEVSGSVDRVALSQPGGWLQTGTLSSTFCLESLPGLPQGGRPDFPPAHPGPTWAGWCMEGTDSWRAHSGGKQEERGESYNAKATGPRPLFALGHGQNGERRNFGGKNNNKRGGKCLEGCGFHTLSLHLQPDWSGRSPFPSPSSLEMHAS